MKINDGVEIKGCRQSERLCRIYLQGVVIGGGEEGQGIEWVEGEMGDAELVGGGCFARFGGRFVGTTIEWVLGALEIPQND